MIYIKTVRKLLGLRWGNIYQIKYLHVTNNEGMMLSTVIYDCTYPFINHSMHLLSYCTQCMLHHRHVYACVQYQVDFLNG